MRNPESSSGTQTRFLIPVKEASAWLGISAFTIYSWAQSRRIPHFKIGKRVMFSREDLKVWVTSHHRIVPE